MAGSSSPGLRKRISRRLGGSAAFALAILLPLVPAHGAPPKVKLESVGKRFTAPLLVTHAGDGSGRIFVVEKGGLIKVIVGARVSSRPFLDLRRVVSRGGEQGLLGLAFHPKYRENGRFFVSFTDEVGDSVVAAYHVSTEDREVADPRSAMRVLFVKQPYANHNGGHLAFGPDGYLYLGLGDGGARDDPHQNGQNLKTLLGKMIRIDIDSGEPYSVPRTNPFVNRDDVRSEIWAVGMRNPWRFSFDRGTGRLFVGDVGQDHYEEIDLIERGGNYGWGVLEATHCQRKGCSTEGFTAPIYEYSHTDGISVTGGYVYRGSRIPSLTGAYVFGDFGSGQVWTLREEPASTGSARWVRETLLDSHAQISSFGEDESGEIYLVDYGGVVYRIVPAS